MALVDSASVQNVSKVLDWSRRAARCPCCQLVFGAGTPGPITHSVDILYRENGKICLLILSTADPRPSELDKTLQLKLKFKYLNNFKCPHFTGMGNNTFTLKF